MRDPSKERRRSLSSEFDPKDALRVSAPAAGSTTVRLRLNGPDTATPAKSKSARLSMRVAVAFEPSQGGAGSTQSRVVTFKRLNGGSR